MSMERVCKKCGAIERIRFNFGDNTEAELEFHNEAGDGCLREISDMVKCKYNPHDYDEPFPDDWDEFFDRSQ